MGRGTACLEADEDGPWRAGWVPSGPGGWRSLGELLEETGWLAWARARAAGRR